MFLLLPLLRAAIHDEMPPETHLSAEQWQRVLRQAKKQTVVGIVFKAVSRLPEEQLPPHDLLTRWLALAHRETRRYDTMSATLARLLDALEAEGLHPVLQKGHAVARFYPDPRLRTSGDIDLWFPEGERSRADSLMRRLGRNVVHTPDNGSRYLLDGIEVEHHSRLIEIHNPLHASELRKVYADHQPVDATLAPGIAARVPAPMAELLMINAHILKHCLGIGIGMRQICDYALAWRRFTDPASPAIDPDEYMALCRRLGIGRWTRTLHRFIDRYLAPGTMEQTPPDGRSPEEEIYDIVADGGNFGQYSSRNSRAAARTGKTWRRKLSTLSAFLNQRSAISSLAPGEAFWSLARLTLGQATH